MVGISWWWFWKKESNYKPLYELKNASQQVRFEIRWSLVTSIVFAFAGVAIGFMWQRGWTQIYLKFDEYPLWYMPLSIVIFALLHEVYFYISHRWMHIPSIYRRIHAVHHRSLEPSPWASFSFHPLEALIEALILPILVIIIPIHPTVFITYLTLMTISAINNHLGVELIPRWMVRLGWAKHFISATHHADHHRHFRRNFGLYFTFMDRLFKTENDGYLERLRK